MKQADNTIRVSTVKSWLAILLFAAGIFGMLYWVAPLVARHLLARWSSIWEDPKGPPLVLLSILILVLAILAAAVIAHGFGRGPRRVERKALVLGSWVIYLPAFVGGLSAIGGLSYLMFSAFLAGGVISTLAWLLIRNDTMANPDWRHWIAVGVVGRGAVDRPEDGTWRVAPLLLVAIGLAITILGFVQVFRARRENRLQKDGLYATVRHPQHMGIAIWTFGLALAASTTAGYMTWFTMLYCYILLSFWEERHLSQRFGSSYDDYRRSTPFMIPFVNVGLPLPESRWWRVGALVGYYLAGMALLCLIMQAVGVTISWHG
jgi:hypothetical protein